MSDSLAQAVQADFQQRYGYAPRLVRAPTVFSNRKKRLKVSGWLGCGFRSTVYGLDPQQAQ